MRLFCVTIILVTSLATVSVQAVDWTFNGFASAGGGDLSIDGNEESGYAGYENEISLKPDSVLGAQLTAEFTERWSSTLQVLSRGRNDFEPEIEWAYLSFQVTDDLLVRAGRLRPPLFMVSDYLDVAYAYPWIRPPQEVYRNAPLTRYEGADAIYSRSIGSWFTSVQVYGGSEQGTQIFNQTEASRELESYIGIALMTQRDALTLRASYHQADVTFKTDGTEQLFATLQGLGFGAVADSLNMNAKQGAFYEAAFVYDRDKWFVRGEATHTDFERGFLADQMSWYLSAGKSFGALTPYVTWSQVEASRQTGFNDPIPQGIDPGLDVLRVVIDQVGNSAESDDTAHTLGVRWDAFARTAIKFEYTYVAGGLESDDDYGLFGVAVNMVF